METEFEFDYELNDKGIYLTPSDLQLIELSESENKSKHAISLLERTISEQCNNSDMLFSTCYYQLRPGKLVKYSQSEFTSHKRIEVIDFLNSSKIETYQGEISSAAQKRIKRKLEVWYSALLHHNSIRENVLQHSIKKMVFLTTTLPAKQYHSDEEIKRSILKPFLRILKSDYECFNYLWKAESQENGNIHFHIILDQYIPKEEIQRKWNTCTEKLGYVSRFSQKHNKLNPPSTQIEVVKNFRQALEYIEKYVCKSSTYRKIEGALWKASKSVQSLEYFEFVSDSVVDFTLDNLVEDKKITYFSADRYSIYYIKGQKISFLIGDLNFKSYMLYQQYLDSYLFTVQQEVDFRSYCFSLSHTSDIVLPSIPLISKISYPMPIQLIINEFDCTIMKKPFINKREKPNIYDGDIVVT